MGKEPKPLLSQRLQPILDKYEGEFGGIDGMSPSDFLKLLLSEIKSDIETVSWHDTERMGRNEVEYIIIPVSKLKEWFG